MQELLKCSCGWKPWERQRVVWEYGHGLQEIEHWIECTNVQCKYKTRIYLNKPERAIEEWNSFQKG